MNLQIDIQQVTISQDSYGQPVETWSDYLPGLWASMITTGGREFYAAQKLNAETSAVFKIRYQTGIEPTMRVKYGDRYFDIINVNDKDERHEFILISCKSIKE